MIIIDPDNKTLTIQLRGHAGQALAQLLLQTVATFGSRRMPKLVQRMRRVSEILARGDSPDTYMEIPIEDDEV